LSKHIRSLAWTVGLSALGLFVFDSARFCTRAAYFVDDPFISMRYAANLVEHGELSFNPGDRVEGYSNLLHVLLQALTFALHGRVPGAVVAADEGTLIVFSAAALQLVVLARLARRTPGHETESAAWYYAWVLTAASWPFAFWSTAGLETPIEGLFYAAVLLCTTRFARSEGSRAPLASLAAVLLGVTLLRFEGVVVAIAVAAVLGRRLLRAKHVRAAAGLMAGVAVPAAAYHLWRIAYFGHLMPNTFVAKATGGSAMQRLLSGASYGGQWLAIAVGGVAMTALTIGASLGRDRVRASLARGLEEPVVLVASTIVATKLLLVVWGGGDWMPGWRMLVPITPLALFLLFRAAFSLGSARVDLRVSGLPALVLGLALVASGRPNQADFPEHSSLPDEAGNLKKLPKGYLSMGDTLERAFGRGGGEVAIGEAGIIPFEARHVRFMDLFGLVDEDMARQPGAMHHKVHVSHVLDRAPAAVVFAHLNVQPPYGPYQYESELLPSPAFHAAYRRVDLGEEMDVLGWALYLRRDVDPAAHGLAWAATDLLAQRATR
jgi:arabinofuranosyltransferase